MTKKSKKKTEPEVVYLRPHFENMATTKLETLQRLRTVLEEPESWTKGAFAKTKEGDYCTPDDKNANCFCLGGAYSRTNPYNVFGLYTVLFPEDSKYMSIVGFNDNPFVTHADVLAVIDAAIEHESKL